MRRVVSRVAFFMLGVAACATPSLSPAGAHVVPITAAPGPECQNLGVVIGQGGGSFGGGWISNDQLTEYAMNDALSKAAAKGATHLQISPPQLGGGSGTTTTATETGIAFKCPPGAAVTPAGPQSSPPATK
jgi:hypothetical protein